MTRSERRAERTRKLEKARRTINSWGSFDPADAKSYARKLFKNMRKCSCTHCCRHDKTRDNRPQHRSVLPYEVE